MVKSTLSVVSLIQGNCYLNIHIKVSYFIRPSKWNGDKFRKKNYRFKQINLMTLTRNQINKILLTIQTRQTAIFKRQWLHKLCTASSSSSHYHELFTCSNFYLQTRSFFHTEQVLRNFKPQTVIQILSFQFHCKLRHLFLTLKKYFSSYFT